MPFTFSIITPSYNQGAFIERTLLSVLSQSIKPVEYVVFDGGSTDNTCEILKKYEQHITWVSEADNGQAHAVNKGLKKVTGDIIGWLNSDDIYYPDALKHVQTFFEKNPEVDIVYGKANHIDKEDQIIEPYPTEPWNLNRFKETCFLSQPAVFFRRRVIETYGLLDESLSYCMDYEYWMRLAIQGAAFAYLPVVLAGSRFYLETKTLGQRIPVHAEINTMLKKKLRKTPDIWLRHYAYIFLEEHGIRGGKTWRSVIEAPATAIMTIYASLRWNHSISMPLLITLLTMIKDYLKAIVITMLRYVKHALCD